MFIQRNRIGLLIRRLLLLFLFQLTHTEAGRIFDVTSIPIQSFAAEAGKKITLPCPGINENSLVNTLKWRTSTTIAHYANGIPLVHNHRVTLLPVNFSLHFHPVLATDTAEYICLVNDRHSPEAIIDLVVQDVPTAPERPLITSFTSRSMNLSWAHSQEPRNAPVTHFLIETRIGENGPWNELPQINTYSNATMYQVTGLTPFTVYSFRLRAINKLGISPPSKESYYIVSLREAPTGKPVAITAHNTSSSSIYISWKSPPPETILGEFLGYRITYRVRDRHNDTTEEIYIRDSNVESHEIHDLEIYTQYVVTLQVFNPEGPGPATTFLVMTDEGVPSKPMNLSIAEVTATTIIIRWHEPKNVNGEIIGYRVFYINQNQTYFATLRSGTSAGELITYVLKDLKPYSEYRISVKAFTWKNEGDASDPVIQRTDISGPSPPIIVNLTCHNQDALYLRWKRPLEYYNSIDFYIISYRTESKGEFQEIKFNTSSTHLETAMIIPNLTTNIMYEVKVRAASQSIINPRQIILGSYSETKRILLQLICEKIEPLQRQHAHNEYEMITLAGIVFSCCGIIMIVMALLLWRKCFHAAYYYLDDPPPQSSNAPLVDWEAPVDVCGEIHSPVPVHEFSKHVAELHSDGDIGFSKEYESIQNESITEEFASEFSQHPDNKAKNRYLNIIAYDHSRVQLRPLNGQKKSIEYINANFIDGYQRQRAFIGTQGPLPDTFDAFWRMIWEQRVSVIVMITNLVERGRRKCDMYWPKDDIETYGVIQVKFIQEDVMATYTVRTFQIKHLKLKKKKQLATEKLVYQYHYTNWPDHGTPDHPLPVLNFVKKSSDANPRDAGPIVVHCSAGVGRTGTYIVLDAMLKQIKQKGVVNVFGFLRHIRNQRNFLVQTEEQYIFIHDALVEAISSGETCLRADQISEIKDDYELLLKQFKLITQFQPSDVHIASASKQVNLCKNRSSLSPLEGSRVHLTPKPGEDGSDYINASWLQGFRRLRDFIVTQHPLVNTIKDFWQMIWDHNVQSVVLLTSLTDTNFPQFWPDESQTIEFDHFRVSYVSKMNKCDYVCREFSMQSIQDDYDLIVRMLHCPSWPELGHPSSIYDFIVDAHHRTHDYRNGPIAVIDRYGGTEASLFCLLASQAMQLEYDNTANVYTYAKLYHHKRPGVWQSVDNIKLIFRILSYLPSDLTLLKCTEIHTELEDMPTATPDLYSKICSNGNISSTLNATQNSIIGPDGGATLKLNGGLYNGNEEFSVVVTEPDNVNV